MNNRRRARPDGYMSNNRCVQTSRSEGRRNADKRGTRRTGAWLGHRATRRLRSGKELTGENLGEHARRANFNPTQDAPSRNRRPDLPFRRPCPRGTIFTPEMPRQNMNYGEKLKRASRVCTSSLARSPVAELTGSPLICRPGGTGLGGTGLAPTEDTNIRQMPSPHGRNESGTGIQRGRSTWTR